MKKNKEIELNEHGLLVFKHKTNQRLFLQRSYRWVDRLTLIDETDGRLVIDSYKYSTYDFESWEPMTVEEYSRVKRNFKEIYNDESNTEKQAMKVEEQVIRLLNEIKELGAEVQTYPITIANSIKVTRYKYRNWWSKNGPRNECAGFYGNCVPTLIVYTDETTDEIINKLIVFRDDLYSIQQVINKPSEAIDLIKAVFN